MKVWVGQRGGGTEGKGISVLLSIPRISAYDEAEERAILFWKGQDDEEAADTALALSGVATQVALDRWYEQAIKQEPVERPVLESWEHFGSWIQKTVYLRENDAWVPYLALWGVWEGDEPSLKLEEIS